MNRTAPHTDVFSRLPPRLAARWNVLPLSVADGRARVALLDPDDLELRENLRTLLNLPVEIERLSEAAFRDGFRERYGIGAEAIEELTESVATEPATDEAEDAESAGMVRFVNDLLCQAQRERATDVHIEPFEDELLVRFRVDGLLHRIPVPSRLHRFRSLLASRIKVLARMNIAERRLPQDGRMRFRAEDDELDIRVSTLPTLHGESLDLRLLPQNRIALGLEELGMGLDHRNAVERLIRRPNGILLVTGPTGHGKTTTLYAGLSRINSPDKKIITIEDPVEVRLKGVNQMPVHSKIGLSFAGGLRAILRQDPDVIMVGEIRDAETAEIAIRASLTGHLVFSTLHTNDALGALTRLVDMGIEPYLVASSLNAVLAQRLVRLRCRACAAGGSGGCEACHGTGFRGRTGLFELLEIDETLRALILSRSPVSALRDHAHRHGFRTLLQDGQAKVRDGLTTPEEVARVTGEAA